MSMTDPVTGIDKPTNGYLSFNMKEGKFYLSLKDQDRVELSKPIQMVVIDDQLEQVRGADQNQNYTVTSNFGKGGKIDFIVTRYPDRSILGKGRWSNIKPAENPNMPNWAKLNKLMAVYLTKQKEYVIFSIYGTCLASYFQHTVKDLKLKELSGRIVTFKKVEKSDKDIYYPVFESKLLDENEKTQAALKQQLMKWCGEEWDPYVAGLLGDSSIAASPEPQNIESSPEPVKEEDTDDLPF